LILEMLMASSVISKYWGVYLNDFVASCGGLTSIRISVWDHFI
jgi:APA family basic amino acid/polyamine antiporter